MTIAVVYDYIPPMGGGAEKVLLDIIATFPDCDLIIGAQIVSTFSEMYLQKIATTFPKVTVHIQKKISEKDTMSFRLFHYSLPQEMQKISFEKYDKIICYTSFLAHTIKGGSHAEKILYMNTPARMLWHLTHSTSMLKRLVPSQLLSFAKSSLLLHDMSGVVTSQKVLCISHAIRQRIKSNYNHDAEVLYPSVHFPELSDDIQKRAEQWQKVFGEYMLHISRIESYKNIDAFVATAHADTKKRAFIIAGNGPYYRKLLSNAEKLYKQPSVSVEFPTLAITAKVIQNCYFLGAIPDEQKWPLLAGAFASFSLNDEDFGMTKVESLAMGTPVIGTNEGATSEIIEHTLGGILLSDSSASSILRGIMLAEETQWNTSILRRKAEEFSPEIFMSRLKEVIL
jgi:glycosyltransferase involved in cell wall biosynthesis